MPVFRTNLKLPLYAMHLIAGGRSLVASTDNPNRRGCDYAVYRVLDRQPLPFGDQWIVVQTPRGICEVSVCGDPEPELRARIELLDEGRTLR